MIAPYTMAATAGVLNASKASDHTSPKRSGSPSANSAAIGTLINPASA